MTDEQIIHEILEARQKELDKGVTDGAATDLAISGVVYFIHHRAFFQEKCELEDTEPGTKEEDLIVQVLRNRHQEVNNYVHNVWDNYQRVQYLNKCLVA